MAIREVQRVKVPLGWDVFGQHRLKATRLEVFSDSKRREHGNPRAAEHCLPDNFIVV
jgi:hypothetical protein